MRNMMDGSQQERWEKLTKTAEKVLVVLCDTVRIEKKDQREF